MKKVYLVNIVMPTPGMSLSAYSYRTQLLAMGYTFAQVTGSIGGGISQGILILKNGILTRR